MAPNGAALAAAAALVADIEPVQHDVLLDVVGKAYGSNSHNDLAANQQQQFDQQQQQQHRNEMSPMNAHEQQQDVEAADLSMSVSFKSRLRQKTQEKIEEKQKKKSEKIREKQQSQQQGDNTMNASMNVVDVESGKKHSFTFFFIF